MAQFKSEESVFNFAIDYLQALGKSLKMCKFASSHGDMNGWYNWLMNAFRELSIKTNSTEDQEFEKDFAEIAKLLNNPLDRKQKRGQIFMKLHKLEMKVRKMIQKKGMGLPGKNDPRYAVLRR